MFKSSTQAIPEVHDLPRHVAIIMDGNGRWATKRHLPRVAGHKKGVDAVRTIVEACAKKGIGYLTLFAFSSENWRRPAEEVGILMTLFSLALERESRELARNNVRLKIVGDLSAFEFKLQDKIGEAQARTAHCTGLVLTVAANYGGRWDVVQATRRMLLENPALANNVNAIQESDIAKYLSLAYAPEPDLFIRTGGEQRISNFMLWQLAYTEFHFTDLFWPDFNDAALDQAIHSYQRRERRFGQTSAQLLGTDSVVSA